MTKKSEKMHSSVVEFMLQHATPHSDMTYDISRKGFILDKCSDITAGIYFIVRKDTNEILKIGKAEGKYGLKGRIETYRSKLTSRTNDHTVNRYYEKMTGPLAGVKLKMYILPLPTELINYLGIQVELQMARSLEQALSRQAEKEGNGMDLSGQH